MTKILAALVAATVSLGAFAQATAPMPATSGAMPMEKASGAKKQSMDKKHDEKKDKKTSAPSKPAA